jgi:hypothetical protein
MDAYDKAIIFAIILIVLSYILIAMRRWVSDKIIGKIPFMMTFMATCMLCMVTVVYSADSYEYRYVLSAITAVIAIMNIIIGIMIKRQRDDLTLGVALTYIYGGALILAVVIFATIFI